MDMDKKLMVIIDHVYYVIRIVNLVNIKMLLNVLLVMMINIYINPNV